MILIKNETVIWKLRPAALYRQRERKFKLINFFEYCDKNFLGNHKRSLPFCGLYGHKNREIARIRKTIFFNFYRKQEAPPFVWIREKYLHLVKMIVTVLNTKDFFNNFPQKRSFFYAYKSCKSAKDEADLGFSTELYARFVARELSWDVLFYESIDIPEGNFTSELWVKTRANEFPQHPFDFAER